MRLRACSKSPTAECVRPGRDNVNIVEAPFSFQRFRISAFQLLTAASFLFTTSFVHADNTWEFSVQVSAVIQDSPPSITLSWPQDVNEIPVSYTVHRKSQSDSAWGSGVTLPGSALNYVDSDVETGGAYEYKIHKVTSAYNGYGFIYVGINAPLIERRGKLILLVDDTMMGVLSAEITRLERDLVGDGWEVLRREVSREASPPAVKAVIQAAYDSDPANVRCVFLLGRIPVPYSGNMAPDDHFEVQGAWPADLYYGDMDGIWTDSSVNNVSAQIPRRWNVPGDGKLDQSGLPSLVELQVGRVDLANMPGRKEWMGPPTFPNEVELLRNYLNKNHAFRHRQFTAEPRGLVYDGAGAREGAGFAASGWRNFAPFFGASQIRIAQPDEFLPILATNSHLWSYANGGGDSQSIAYLGGTANFNGGRTTDFVEMNIKTVFTMLFGSHMGDWDSEDNLMRAVLATPDFGLTCAYAGAPHWFFHHMALGENIGFSARLTQNNPTNAPLYPHEVNQAAGLVHVALMGDPTLRMHVVAPPSALAATSAPGGTQLTWTPSSEPVEGCHVYFAATSAGPFDRLTGQTVSGAEYFHGTAAAGVYMVRAVKLQLSGSGTYFNPSQGVFAEAAAPPSHGDSDNDGMSDAHEAIAGTDPNDSDSVLRFSSVKHESDNMLGFSWTSVPGKTYRVASRAFLDGESWEDFSPDIPSQGIETSWTAPVSPDMQLFRIRVVP
jgi:hypothetical protein